MNSKKRCKHCGEYFRNEDGVKLPKGFFCSMDHAIEWGRQKSQKQITAKKNKLKREDRKNLKARKEALKTKPQLTEEAQKEANKYVRVRDKNKPCISCGKNMQGLDKIFGGGIDAGHYISRGAAPHLRFNLYNIHAQCVTCNKFKSGNSSNYRIRLIKRIGLEKVERLERDQEPKNYIHHDLRRIIKIFRKRSKHLTKLRGST